MIKTEEPKIYGYYKWTNEPIKLKPYRTPWVRLRRTNIQKFSVIKPQYKVPEDKICFTGMEILDEYSSDTLELFFADNTNITDLAKNDNEEIKEVPSTSKKKRAKRSSRSFNNEPNDIMKNILNNELSKSNTKSEYLFVAIMLSRCDDMNTLRQKIYLAYPAATAETLFASVYSACKKYLEISIDELDISPISKSLPDRARNTLLKIHNLLKKNKLCDRDIHLIIETLKQSKSAKKFRNTLKDMYSEERATQIYETASNDFKTFINIFCLK